jgi:phosphatidate cytidylyltransferase
MNPIARRIVTALTTAALAVCAILYAPVAWFRPVCLVLAALAGVELALLLRSKVSEERAKTYGAAVLFGLLLAVTFSILPLVARRFGNAMLLYLIAIVKISDMGGFAFGVGAMKLFGRTHKLCPTISPNKSWEGLFGSVFASCVISCAFLPVTHFVVPKALAFGVAAAILGTAGDLVESKLKRWVGVKDSATFMPAGLGGFLDMFDSLLIAPAVLVWFI